MVNVQGLKKYFHTRKSGLFDKAGIIKAVDDISFTISEGETLGLVGESGSGKTTAARAILRLIEPDSGDIFINDTSINRLSGKELRRFRKNMQIVFQDPYGSLNPRMTVGKIVTEPLKIHTNMNKKEIQEKLKELLQIVGLDIEQSNRYPHEFSGGQRQRIGIARAIAMNPKFIILDEPVSALDVSIQGQILNLLSDLQDTFNLTYLFVAHDLAVVEHISNRVIVMYVGRIVEMNFKRELYNNPFHPYTQSLLQSIPDNKPIKHGFQVLSGEIPSPENPPKGCYFHPRCPNVLNICKREYPEMKDIGGGKVACHLY
ncbi:MAG: oligopeptide/dipeptide ABC transporter ATP-binding protein [Spirochaetota bacterium]|nr:oligopeptide/dipeptide ABC transporter ATP-binding protein [Spirochaetota bacterium]